jgi:hypothetical protein
MVMCLPMAMLISIPSARRRAFAESQSVTVVRAASRTRMITLEGRYFPAPVVQIFRKFNGKVKGCFSGSGSVCYGKL